MIQPAGRLEELASAQRIFPSGSNGVPSNSQSFRAELSDQLARPVSSGSANPSLPAHLPPGQKPVTWRQDSDGGSDSTTGASSSTSQPSNPTSSTTTSTTSATSTTSGTSASSGSQPMSQQAFDDAYWAAQPPAVQQLRTIQNPAERTDLATQLAQEGYTIDVPIMVWGWDPQITTELRQSYGYTWVPSALQQPVAVAPGLTQGSQDPYNPSNPPAGSITV